MNDEDTASTTTPLQPLCASNWSRLSEDTGIFYDEPDPSVSYEKAGDSAEQDRVRHIRNRKSARFNDVKTKFTTKQMELFADSRCTRDTKEAIVGVYEECMQYMNGVHKLYSDSADEDLRNLAIAKDHDKLVACVAFLDLMLQRYFHEYYLYTPKTQNMTYLDDEKEEARQTLPFVVCIMQTIIWLESILYYKDAHVLLFQQSDEETKVEKINWEQTLHDQLQAKGFSIWRHILSWNETLQKARLDFIMTQVWNNAVLPDSDLIYNLQVAARVRLFYFLQHDLLLSSHMKPCPIDKFPSDWRNAFRKRLQTIFNLEIAQEFGPVFRNNVYDYELAGNAFYKFSSERNIKSRTASLVVVQEMKTLDSSRLIFDSLNTDKKEIMLKENKHTYRDMLILTTVDEIFYQSFRVQPDGKQRIGFLSLYFISNRDFVEKQKLLTCVHRTKMPLVERRPIIVNLLGRWCLWHRTDVVYYSEEKETFNDQIEDLILTWVYLVCTEYDGRLDVRQTKIEEFMRKMHLSTQILDSVRKSELENELVWEVGVADDAPAAADSTASAASVPEQEAEVL